jgi:integrase
MSSINFYLDKPNRKNECPIFLVYQSRGKKFKYFTKEKISSNAWEDEKQKVKKNYAVSDSINSQLQNLSDILKKIERDARYEGIEPTIETLKTQFYDKIGKQIPGNDFYSIYDKYIESSKTNKTSGTVNNIKSALSLIRKFENAKKYTIRFDTINLDFYERFKSYLINDLGQLNNSVTKKLKMLKAFLNYATAHGYNTKNMAYKKFKASWEEVDLIYLTDEELLSIYRLELENPILEHVKDNFCFACFTGLRFSDVSKINADNIQDDFIVLKTQKTKDFLRIPLNDYAKDILKKYDHRLPPFLKNMENNEYLIEIGKKAKIETPVRLTRYSGSKKIETTLPKFNFIASHTARRTFITLALEKGIRAEVVMEMTGHKTYSSFKKYIKITDKVKQIEMNRFWIKPVELKVVHTN